MAALQCEICGGKLVGRPGGIFECDSCGMEYDTAWAKAKIQEIKGTVKVEGTVEVTGTVKVEGTVTKEDLVKRGQEALEVEQWNRAKDLFNQALDMAPSYTLANLGLEMAAFHCKDIKTLAVHHANGDIRYFDVTYKDYMRRRAEEWMCRKEFDKVKAYAKSVGEAWISEYESVYDEEAARLKAIQEAKEREREEARIAKELEEQKRLEYEQRAYEERQQKLRNMLPELRARAAKVKGMISANANECVAVNENCEVLSRPERYYHFLSDTKEWKDIVTISVCDDYIMGLKADGTVVYNRQENAKPLDVNRWNDIISIHVGLSSAIGVKVDGTVVFAGHNTYGQGNVDSWTDIVEVCTGAFSLGLKSNGTVVATGWNHNGECDVSDWKDIVSIASGKYHAVGLKADGTVVATGKNDTGCCNVSEWNDIIAINACESYTIGLKADGTVVGTGNVGLVEFDFEAWTDIVALCVGDSVAIGVKVDGTVVAKGFLDRVSFWKSWKLFDHIDTLENKQEKLKKNILERQEQQRQWRSQEVCQHCGSPFKKGLFGKRCSQCWEPKDY